LHHTEPPQGQLQGGGGAVGPGEQGPVEVYL